MSLADCGNRAEYEGKGGSWFAGAPNGLVRSSCRCTGIADSNIPRAKLEMVAKATKKGYIDERFSDEAVADCLEAGRGG
jgi:hypothetical protein